MEKKQTAPAKLRNTNNKQNYWKGGKRVQIIHVLSNREADYTSSQPWALWRCSRAPGGGSGRLRRVPSVCGESSGCTHSESWGLRQSCVYLFSDYWDSRRL